MVWGLGLGAWGLGLGGWGLGVWGLGFGFGELLSLRDPSMLSVHEVRVLLRSLGTCSTEGVGGRHEVGCRHVGFEFFGLVVELQV